MTDFSTDFFITKHDIGLIFPYLAIIIFAALTAAAGPILGKSGKSKAKDIFFIPVIGALLAAFFTYQLRGTNAVTFGGLLISDYYSHVFFYILLALFIVIVPASLKEDLRHSDYAILPAILLGMMLTASAGNIVIVLIGMETVSLSIAIGSKIGRPEKDSLKTRIKKSLISDLAAAAVFIAGIIIVKKSAGTLDFFGIKEFFLLRAHSGKEITLYIGPALSFLGFAVKCIQTMWVVWKFRTSRSGLPLMPVLTTAAFTVSFSAVLHRSYIIFFQGM